MKYGSIGSAIRQTISCLLKPVLLHPGSCYFATVSERAEMLFNILFLVGQLL